MSGDPLSTLVTGVTFTALEADVVTVGVAMAALYIVFVGVRFRSRDGAGGRVAAISLAAVVSSSLMRAGLAFGDRVVLLRRVARMLSLIHISEPTRRTP